jgi:hypothetical protein
VVQQQDHVEELGILAADAYQEKLRLGLGENSYCCRFLGWAVCQTNLPKVRIPCKKNEERPVHFHLTPICDEEDRLQNNKGLHPCYADFRRTKKKISPAISRRRTAPPVAIPTMTPVDKPSS